MTRKNWPKIQRPHASHHTYIKKCEQKTLGGLGVAYCPAHQDHWSLGRSIATQFVVFIHQLDPGANKSHEHIAALAVTQMQRLMQGIAELKGSARRRGLGDDWHHQQISAKANDLVMTFVDQELVNTSASTKHNTRNRDGSFVR
jgi:hypothetical protein